MIEQDATARKACLGTNEGILYHSPFAHLQCKSLRVFVASPARTRRLRKHDRTLSRNVAGSHRLGCMNFLTHPVKSAIGEKT